MKNLEKKKKETKPVVEKKTKAGKQIAEETPKKSGKKAPSDPLTSDKELKTSKSGKSAVKETVKKTANSAVRSKNATASGNELKTASPKKENAANRFYKLLTEDEKEQQEPEEVDPAALARGDEPMTIVGHLDELRSRILFILVAFMVLTGVAFYFSDILVYYVNKPFLESGNKLNIFTLIGGFMLKFKISAATALFILVPIIIFQIWRFIVPAIERENRIFSRMTIISAVLLFYSGAAFVFFIILPAAIKVMLSFVGKEMISTIGADDYLNFILFSSLIMGVLFEVPVIILVLTRLGIISPQFLIRKRKYAIVIIWIIAAIVTPQPDPLSQSLVGVPLMILYEISIIIAKIVAMRERKKLNS